MQEDDATRFIYGLVDPRYNCVRYVGMANNPWLRTFGRYRSGAFWNSHWETAIRGDGTSWKDNWLRQLHTEGLEPKLLIIEHGVWTREETFEREKYWIKLLKSHGEQLTNLTDGGDGFGTGRVYTEEARLNTGEASKKSWDALTDDERRIRSEKMHKNIDHSNPAYRKKISVGVKASWDRLTAEERAERGKTSQSKLTPEQRKARAVKAANTRRRRGIDTGPAISKALSGRKMSDEHRQQARERLLSRPNPMENPESRNKIGRKVKNSWANLTPEQRAERSRKMSEAQKRRQARARDEKTN